MLTADDILEYIENKHLERDINILLLFNDIGFFVLPLKNPRFVYFDKRFLFQANGYNIFANDFFEMDFTQISDRISKWISNPQHLYACEIGYEDHGIIEIAYSRNDEGIVRIWKTAVSEFIECADIQTLEQLHNAISSAKERFQNYMMSDYAFRYNLDEICEPELFWKTAIMYEQDYLNEGSVRRIIRRKYDETIEYFSNNFKYGIVDYELYLGRHPETNKYVELQLSILFKNQAILKTPISYEYMIVSGEDKIPDILYNIATDIRATVLKMAVGYAYKKGLELLVPTMRIVKTLGGTVELGIGALQNHNNSQHISGMDKITADYINILVKDGFIDVIFTSDETFYHGKYYYISNGEKSYVLMGSSNITKSAYTDNTELDVLFYMDSSEPKMIERQRLFTEWYDMQRRNAILLSRLDIEKFENIVHTGRHQKKQKPEDIIRHVLTDQEEKERLDLIMKFSPDEIHKSPFKGVGKASFKAFKKYHVFEFYEKNMVVLESFSYGDACYVFHANDFSKIQSIFSYTSKSQIKDAECFITSIEHDGNYKQEFISLMMNC